MQLFHVQKQRNHLLARKHTRSFLQPFVQIWMMLESIFVNVVVTNTWHDNNAITLSQHLSHMQQPGYKKVTESKCSCHAITPLTTCILKIDSKCTTPFIFQSILHVCRVHNVNQGLDNCSLLDKLCPYGFFNSMQCTVFTIL